MRGEPVFDSVWMKRWISLLLLSCLLFLDIERLLGVDPLIGCMPATHDGVNITRNLIVRQGWKGGEWSADRGVGIFNRGSRPLMFLKNLLDSLEGW